MNIEDYISHICQETICLKCLYRWIDVRPEGTLLKDLECPKCFEVGCVIATGEQLFNEDGEVIE